MLLWAVITGRHLLTPRYRAKLVRSIVFIIPILLLAVRPVSPGGSSMVRSYENSGFSMGSGNGSGQMAEGPGQQTAPVARGKSQGPVSHEKTGLALPDRENAETDGYTGTDAYPERLSCHSFTIGRGASCL